MNSLCALLFLAGLAIVYASPLETSTFPTKYDNIDVPAIMANKRLRDKYYLCLMDKGNCTPDGTELRNSLDKAIALGCEGCSETQKKWAEYVVKWFNENERDKFDAMMEKYDKNGTYRLKYKDQLKEHGIKV